jgi:hypothetical protein
MLTNDEINVLLDSKTCPIVEKYKIVDENIINNILDESLSLVNSNMLVPSSMGASSSLLWNNSTFRGDKTIWLTPNLCKSHNLTNISLLVKKVMEFCRIIRQSPNSPNQTILTDFSAQLAVYVIIFVF